MKLKNIAAAACASALLLVLTGCRLAKETEETGKVQDRLMGVFITTEYLDLFDMEGYLNDHLKGASGGELTPDGTADAYNGRLYAALTTKEHIAEDSGKKYDTKEYTFENVPGIPFFATDLPMEDGTDTTVSSVYSEGMTDSHFGTHYSDDEDKITLEGTIYLVPGKNGHTHYLNPVYQSADGRIYATTGQGMSVLGVQSEGDTTAQKMEESITVTENGVSKKKTAVINVSIATMLPPQKIVLLQMDKSSAVLSRQEYLPGKLPERLTPHSATEYMVLESHKVDFDGQEKIDRALFSRQDETISSFYPTDEGVIFKQYTTIHW